MTEFLWKFQSSIFWEICQCTEITEMWTSCENSQGELLEYIRKDLNRIHIIGG